MIQPDPVTPRFSPWFKHWSKIGGILVIVLFGMAFFGFAMARMRHQWHQGARAGPAYYAARAAAWPRRPLNAFLPSFSGTFE